VAFIYVKKQIGLVLMLAAAITLAACEQPSVQPGQPAGSNAQGEPVIEASPVNQGEGEWKVAQGEAVTLTINAPGAQAARVFYRPVVASDRIVVLKRINAPADNANGKLSAQVKTTADFAGDVWAEVSYPDGTKKETKPMMLAAQDAINAGAAELAENAAHGDESERSDKFTAGKIETAAFAENQSDIKITVDVPAFKLTLWQNDKEVKTYDIGVGRKDFPLVIGMRKATQVIWNPDWVPPDSEWIEDYKYKVEPGEQIPADDPRNPLGKVKIPLGEGYLIHQAASARDIGRLVSHGCVRMMKDDLYDLAEKIVAARGWPVSREQIEQAKNNKDRLVAKLETPLLVDINYDTQVVEGGKLYIYPDIYGRNTSTVENLRSELQTSGVNATLDDQTLKQILDSATAKEKFVVSIADLNAGKALAAGRKEPLIAEQGTQSKSQEPGSASRRQGKR
jgi:lipoprotein-anchoring transpeptidase ErfK/SrfK